ncbi:class II fumarate hydratase [Salinivibrio socompensis]|uniref:class II fumarate hydratase n=1 Tax=Salinivibrio socompensis TaxID=1510206 RepID=UPI000470D54D|nr:class II fumarate hydratase [Salinivibrio socompensis]
MMAKTRIEKDSMGNVEVPSGALYQAQTQRAVNNFAVSDQTMPEDFIRALAMVKHAAATANEELGLLDGNIAHAIRQSAEAVMDGEHLAQFPVDVFQTGSGTSSNMNMNEVLATLASRHSGESVSPNDHVNMSQSSNDSVPTAIQISATLGCEKNLLPALAHLRSALQEKKRAVGHIVKTGRTHLMDAMPVTLGQELEAWSQQIEHAMAQVTQSLSSVRGLAQGGTAVGTGINAHPMFAERFARAVSELTGTPFSASDNPFFAIGSQDALVALHGQLKTSAVATMKLSNDLRWMNSGPLAGLGEIELEALQPGSSIMPGKVNPVIPESAAMVAAQVMGNDTTVTVAGQSGNFELNVMLPVIALNLLQSINLLAGSSRLLADKAIRSFKVREDNLQAALSRNPILVTALNPVVGYLKAAEIAKKAYQQGRPILDVADEETDLGRDKLAELLDPTKLTQGGIAE